ncbi:peptidoglycan-associated lipoprotein Pal [Candidatus Schneideria nysicola]|uniref:peptidoglycan-associated lipoprotein Pal n=1 Tax=Candidatus Schneideria nysicola TaxID=1081631 RepID=UPI001CAA4FCA|nr:peptidoglycan-associated lipoprotein Pal [Candidatus Schneideria nysicola]
MQFDSNFFKVFFLIGVVCTLTACRYPRSTVSHTKAYDPNSTSTPHQSQYWNEITRFNIQELKRENTIFFDLNQYSIKFDFFPILNKHANFLLDHPFCKILIEGHTDERGTSEYNIALGERRANTIKMYLQGKGVSSNQLMILSYGKEKPLALGHDEKSYAQNRRAVLVY